MDVEIATGEVNIPMPVGVGAEVMGEGPWVDRNDDGFGIELKDGVEVT